MQSNQHNLEDPIQLANSLIESLLDLATENSRRYAEFFASQQTFVVQATKEQLDMLPEVMKLQSTEEWIEWQSERLRPALKTNFAKLDDEFEQLQLHQRDMFTRLCDYWATSSQTTLQMLQQQYPLKVTEFDSDLGFASLMKALIPTSTIPAMEDTDKADQPARRRNTRNTRKAETVDI